MNTIPGLQFGAAGNTFKGSMNFTLTYTADNDAGTAGVSTVQLKRACGKGSATGLPAGVTMTGDFTSQNELQDSFNHTLIKLDRIVLESATTAHFTGVRKITMYELPFNGRTPEKAEILLSEFKVSDGSGTNSTLTLVFQEPIYITPRTVIELELIKNSALSITGFYSWQETSKALAQVG